MSDPLFSSADLERSFPLDSGLTLQGPSGHALTEAFVALLREGECRQRAPKAADEARFRFTAETLLANLVKAAFHRTRPGCFVAVSLNRQAYVDEHLSYPVMVAARKRLLQLDLVEGRLGFQTKREAVFGEDRRIGRRTRLRATPALLAMFAEAGVDGSSLARCPRDVIWLKDEAADAGPEPAEVARSRQTLAWHNSRLREADIRLPISSWSHMAALPDDRGEWGDDGLAETYRAGDPSRSQVHRTFNRSWELGGRIYGGWWMSTPKTQRRFIVIDGESTVELDYGRLHPTLLYAKAGKHLEFDPYAVEGMGGPDVRDLAKKTVQRLLNRQPTPGRPLGPLKAFKWDTDRLPAGVTFPALVEALESRLEAIRQWFGTGAGLRLQREDSDLAVDVIDLLRSQDILCLSVHDSFIVKAADADTLHQAMTKAFFDRYGFDPIIG
jgi:hypothetical protein